MGLWEKITQNHLLMMIICCVVPLAIILLAIQYFNLSRSYAWWIVLILCPLMHYFMMKSMHKEGSHGCGGQTMEGKKKKSCH